MLERCPNRPISRLFQAPGIGAHTKHFQIVIRFQNQDIGVFQVFRNGIRHMSDIGELCDANSIRTDAECDGFGSIVRNGERRDVRIANSKGDAWL